MLKIANLARSVFFYHLLPKIDKNADIKQRILAIKTDNPEYDYRRAKVKLSVVNHKEIIACQLSRSPNWALVQKMLIQTEKLPRDASPIRYSEGKFLWTVKN